MSGAPRKAIDRAQAALGRVTALGQGRITSAVLVGSAVLGDWREDRSDVDLLLVTDAPLSPEVRKAWTQAARLGAKGTELVLADPAALAGTELNVMVALQTASQSGLVLRGSAPAAPDRNRLAAILEGNLGSYWQPWLDRARGRGRGLGWPTAAMFTPFGTVWSLAGIARIRSTLVDGRIISKREALNRALGRLPEFREILDEAGRLRDGAAPRMGRLERRRQALACADDLLSRRW